jgi:hypothetical protein
MNHKSRTRSVSCKVKEEQYQSLQLLADREGRPLGEWCREVILASIEGKALLTEAFARLFLEELVALRSIVSSVIYDLASEHSLSVERMNQIIAHADQVKFERAGKIIEQVLKRESETRHE